MVASTATLRARPDLARVAAARRTEIDEAEQALNRIARERAVLVAERAAQLDALARPLDPEPVQAHLRQKVLPATQVKDPRTRFLRIWSTVSSPLLFAAVAVLIIAPNIGLVAGAGVFAVGFLAVEALARRRLAAFVVSLFLLLVRDQRVPRHRGRCCQPVADRRRQPARRRRPRGARRQHA